MGVGVYIHLFMTSALDGGEWLAPLPGRFIPGERVLGTHWIGGWVGPRPYLDDEGKRETLSLAGLEVQPLGRLARSQSLCRLRYPGPRVKYDSIVIRIIEMRSFPSLHVFRSYS
jgi:hypothetical protein